MPPLTTDTPNSENFNTDKVEIKYWLSTITFLKVFIYKPLFMPSYSLSFAHSFLDSYAGK